MPTKPVIVGIKKNSSPAQNEPALGKSISTQEILFQPEAALNKQRPVFYIAAGQTDSQGIVATDTLDTALRLAGIYGILQLNQTTLFLYGFK